MIENIYNFLWDIPMLVGIFSCFFMFRVLYSDELGTTRSLTRGIVSFSGVWREKVSLFDGAFAKTLIIMFSRGSILMMAEFIWVGGAGSLFWFLISGLMTVSIRYIQTAILYKNRVRGNFGMEYAIIKSLGGKRHFESARAMASIWKFSIMTYFILMPQLFFVSNMIKGRLNVSVGSIIFALLGLIGVYIFMGERLKKATIKFCVGLIFTYALIVILGVIRDISVSTLAIEAAFKDAFQLEGFVGEVMNKGIIPCIGIGVAMGLYMGNFVFDDCIVAIKKEEANLERLGAKVMLASVFHVGFVCFFTGLTSVMTYVSSINLEQTPVYDILSLHSFGVGVVIVVVILSGVIGAYEDIKRLNEMLSINIKRRFSEKSCFVMFLALSGLINLILISRGITSTEWIELIMIILFLSTLINIFLIFSGAEDYRKSLKNKG